MSVQQSLLEAPPASAVGAGAEWVVGLTTGSLALGLAILGMAFLGFLLLSGNLPFRRAGKVVVGAFLLFGAPAIAAALMTFGGEGDAPVPVSPEPVVETTPRADLPPANYDPYAGASLRRD
ncbi:MAG: TrbC/VirB2 family protein [Sphingomonadaceae bacterium]|nr:TrbC/VirB2 family protein [Sphingomonadaceae bacterium]